MYIDDSDYCCVEFSLEVLLMTKKRFERIYADVDVFCRDHNAKGISQLIEKEDYDKIVDLLNALHEENQTLKAEVKSLREDLGFIDMELEEMEDLE